ncbi:MAG: VOC family protein [Acidobacteria bacterium]|nr:VOC family protein [Acidobacteriota bacterium]
MFEIESIDHVALAVRDVRRSADWYRQVLGLQRLYEEVWGDYPAVVAAGATSIALFPVEGAQPKGRPGRDTLAMRHLAFRVDAANFARARQALTDCGIVLEFQDHGIARSMYFHDPDGHELEITTYDLTHP